MATCNPFKVGDKVKIKEDPYGILNRAGFRLNTIYTVKQVDEETDRLYLKETLGCLHYTHFDFYKEEKAMSQQTQQKTKRVPFTHELWEKYKDVAKIIYIHSGGEVLGFAYFPQADSRFRYVYLTRAGTAPTSDSGKSFYLEIPVTTKRIPFNPELKDAKVFYGKIELTEWFQAKTGVICGTHTIGFGGEDTSLYHPNHLEMEIDE